MTVDELVARGTAARQAALEPALAELHRRVIRHFVLSGRAFRRGWFDDHAEDVGLEAAYATDALAVADLVHVANGSIAVAYPFSGRPTRFTVQLADRSIRWAMCAIDALGIAHLAPQDAVITSTDPGNHHPVRVSHAGLAWTWDPASTIVTVGSGGGCSSMNFHVDEASASTYFAHHSGGAGTVLAQDAAISLADQLFGALLNPSRRRR